MSNPNLSTANCDDCHGDTDTHTLTTLVKYLQQRQMYFLLGFGSNRHNQLSLQSTRNLLPSSHNFFKECETFVVYSGTNSDATIKQLDAGDAHSALLTESGELFLWGSNQYGQLGSDYNIDTSMSIPIAIIPKFHQPVEKIALGHSHTAVLERSTGIIHFLGLKFDCGGVDKVVPLPYQSSMDLFPSLSFVDVAAGHDHAVGITDMGGVVTFGSLQSNVKENPWIPQDGSRILQVACGHEFTMALDNKGRIWTCGDNTYGQLGRFIDNDTCSSFQLVPNFLGESESRFHYYISCGSYHCIVAIREDISKSPTLYGWGRNDNGQLGLGFVSKCVETPTTITTDLNPSTKFSCGLSSTYAVDVTGHVWFCGQINIDESNTKVSSHSFVKLPTQVSSPGGNDITNKVLVASGANHFLAGFTSRSKGNR
jgi:alpha-tubulin suppressor-like RCC1 family protein